MNGNDLNARLDDMQRQLDKLFKLFGLPSWAEQERQRLDNEAARGTKMPFNANQSFGEIHRPKPHEAK
jgi:hypothetical protein